MIKNIFSKLQSYRQKNTKSSKPKAKYFLDKLADEVGNFKVIFDVGAFQGGFTNEILSLSPNATIHCFEPSGETFKILQNKFIKNPKIHLVNAAVSDVSGKAQLNINSFSETNSLLKSSNVSDEINVLTANVSKEDVNLIQLDEYCMENDIKKIQLVKIDTQGNSFKILKGLHKLLTQKNIDYLYVEAEFIEIYDGEKLFSEIEILMRGYDYSIIDIYNLNYIKNRLGWCDILFKLKSF